MDWRKLEDQVHDFASIAVSAFGVVLVLALVGGLAAAAYRSWMIAHG